ATSAVICCMPMVQSPPPRNSSHTERDHILALLLRARRERPCCCAVSWGSPQGQRRQIKYSRSGPCIPAKRATHVRFGSWPCQNVCPRDARRKSRSNKNCIFYISWMYEFSHSQGQKQTSRPVWTLSALPPKADHHGKRPLAAFHDSTPLTTSLERRR